MNLIGLVSTDRIMQIPARAMRELTESHRRPRNGTDSILNQGNQGNHPRSKN